MTGAATEIVILIPTYNSAKYITATLDSLESQDLSTPPALLIHIADDCSTDDTLDIIAKRPQGRFTLAITSSHTNVGERQNVNRAIEALRTCGADWILILHSDDIAKPSWLRILLSRVASCDDRVGTICSSWDNLLPDDSIVRGEDDATRCVERVSGGTAAVLGTLRAGCWWHISGCAIRTRALHDIGGFNTRMPQIGDWEWLLRCLQKGWAVEYIPRTLIVYRLHSQSVSCDSFAKCKDIIESLTLARKYSDVMPIRELISFHVRRQQTVSLRILRSLAQFRLRRVIHLVGVMGRVGISLIRCIREYSRIGLAHS